MFDPQTKQVVFVPSGRNSTFTDPSYHLPAFYELWALWAAEDNAFWSEAAAESRAFFHRAANPKTGLMPDYSNFDGTPTGGDHADFRFDAWRTLSNVAVDFAWFGKDPWQVEQSDRVLAFLASQGPVRTGTNTPWKAKRSPATTPPAWWRWPGWRRWPPTPKPANPSSRRSGIRRSRAGHGVTTTGCFTCWGCCT